MTECVRGPVCGNGYVKDHHGWDCPLSNPLADIQAAVRQGLADPRILKNPILRESALKIAAAWGVEEPE